MNTNTTVATLETPLSEEQLARIAQMTKVSLEKVRGFNEPLCSGAPTTLELAMRISTGIYATPEQKRIALAKWDEFSRGEIEGADTFKKALAALMRTSSDSKELVLLAAKTCINKAGSLSDLESVGAEAKKMSEVCRQKVNTLLRIKSLSLVKNAPDAISLWKFFENTLQEPDLLRKTRDLITEKTEVDSSVKCWGQIFQALPIRHPLWEDVLLRLASEGNLSEIERHLTFLKKKNEEHLKRLASYDPDRKKMIKERDIIERAFNHFLSTYDQRVLVEVENKTDYEELYRMMELSHSSKLKKSGQAIIAKLKVSWSEKLKEDLSFPMVLSFYNALRDTRWMGIQESIGEAWDVLFSKAKTKEEFTEILPIAPDDERRRTLVLKKWLDFKPTLPELVEREKHTFDTEASSLIQAALIKQAEESFVQALKLTQCRVGGAGFRLQSLSVLASQISNLAEGLAALNSCCYVEGRHDGFLVPVLERTLAFVIAEFELEMVVKILGNTGPLEEERLLVLKAVELVTSQK